MPRPNNVTGLLATAELAPLVAGIGTEVNLAVLTHLDRELIGVDLGSGAFVRAHATQQQLAQEPIDAYEVVKAHLRVPDQVPDPAEREAVTLASPVELTSRLRKRQARRLIRSIVMPPGGHLLGFPGSSTPYWTLAGTTPSLALIKPEKGPQLRLPPGEETPAARFRWGGVDHRLPVENPRLARALTATVRRSLGGAALATQLGYRPMFVLVTLSPPRAGHCYKTVVAFLPKR